jgi:hypothetical protein
MRTIDIKRNQWVLISGWSDNDLNKNAPFFAGHPMKVIAKNLPFMVVEMDGDRGVIDSRDFHFQKANRQYRNAVKTVNQKETPAQPELPKITCIKCHSEAIRMRWVSAETWRPVCTDCGTYQDEPQPK